MLEDYGTLVQEAEVIMIDGPNKPGTIAEMAHRLGAAKVNIEYLYCATPRLGQGRPAHLQAFQRAEGAQGAESAEGVKGGHVFSKTIEVPLATKIDRSTTDRSRKPSVIVPLSSSRFDDRIQA